MPFLFSLTELSLSATNSQKNSKPRVETMGTVAELSVPLGLA